jgi:hypothetical protein
MSLEFVIQEEEENKRTTNLKTYKIRKVFVKKSSKQ